MKSAVMKACATAMTIGALALGAPASAEVLTFDNITTGNEAPIPNGYGGFSWDNMFVLDGNSVAPSGYQNGIVSGEYVAFNGFANSAMILSSATQFSLDSGYFTGAWNDGLQILVEGFGNGGTGTPLYSTTFTVNTSGPSLQSFGWSGLGSVRFSSFGGTPNPQFSGAGAHFALDNLMVNGPAVPEPATWAFMIVGFGAVGASMRLSRRRQPGLATA